MVWILESEDEYIKKLEAHGLTKEEIDSKVKEAIQKMKGWIDEKTALFVVAKELGLEVDPQAMKHSSEQDYSINNLTTSMQNVNVVGRILSFSDILTFNRKDGTPGLYSWFWLYDSKDKIKVVVWDERSKIVKTDSFSNDVLIRLLNGQVKSSRDGNLEIHVGNRGDIEISPSDINPLDFPPLDYSKFKVKISEITPISSIDKNMITVEGEIEQLYPKRTVKKRATNEDLYVQRLTLKDESDAISVVFWDKDTKLLDKMEEGATILLENLIAKPLYNDESKLELTFKNGSKLKLIKKAKPPKKYSIGEITTMLSRVTVVGEIGAKNDVRTFTRSDETVGKFQRIQLQDGTGSIQVVFWEEDTSRLDDIEVGYTIKLENVGVQSDFRAKDKAELVFKTSSKITVLNDANSATIDKILTIEEILDKEKICSFEGQITFVEPLKTLTRSDGSNLKIFSVHISDNTAAIQLTFWEENAEEHADLGVGDNIRVLRVNVKINNRIGINSATFQRNSSLEKNIDFKLVKQHIIPEYTPGSQNATSLGFKGIYTTIGQIDKEGWYEIKGNISDIKRISVYEACATCLRNISNDTEEKTNCICENGPKKSIYRIIVSTLMEDGTGTLPVTFFGDEAEKLINQESVTIHVKKQSSDYEEFENQIKDTVKMLDIAVMGTVSPNKFSQEFEMKVKGFKSIDLEDESMQLIDDIEK